MAEEFKCGAKWDKPEFKDIKEVGSVPGQFKTSHRSVKEIRVM